MNEPRPVTRVEVTEKNRTLRIVLAIVFAVIGAIGITTGIMSALNRETGWQTIQVVPEVRNSSEDFLFRYNFSGSGGQVAAVNKKLEAAYEEASIKSYQLFTADEEIAGVNNVLYLNRHPNEVVTVDPLLYDAFAQLEGTQYLYLGPVYRYYYNLILSADEITVSSMDPATDPEAMSYVNQIAAFATSGEDIRLELMDNNQVQLHVSQAYLDFAEVEEIETFIDFAYMTNAFIIDYLAETFRENGLTEGYLVSFDGYTRNLCNEGAFSFTVFDREQNRIYPAGELAYKGPVSMVYLKDYPTEESEGYYRVNGNHFVSLYADPADGMYKSTTQDFIGYSYEESCVQVLLKMLPAFLGESFAAPEDVYSVWCRDSVIYYNDATLAIAGLLQNEEVSYQAELMQ